MLQLYTAVSKSYPQNLHVLITLYKNSKVNFAQLLLVAQLWPTLYDPPNFSGLPSSSVHGILQAKMLEWLTILQGIFPNQESNPGLPFWQILYYLLEKEMVTHSSTLAWKIPWMEEPGRLQSVGLQRVGYDWATSPSPYLTIFTILYQGSPCNVITYLTPGKGMATTPVSLSRKSHAQKSLVGSSPWGHKSRTWLSNESTTNHEERKQWLLYKQGWFSYSKKMPFSSSSLLRVTM